MRIRFSTRPLPVVYEIADAPPQLVNEGDETMIAFDLTNVRGGCHAALMIRPDEIDRLYAAKRRLSTPPAAPSYSDSPSK